MKTAAAAVLSFGRSVNIPTRRTFAGGPAGLNRPPMRPGAARSALRQVRPFTVVLMHHALRRRRPGR